MEQPTMYFTLKHQFFKSIAAARQKLNLNLDVRVFEDLRLLPEGSKVKRKCPRRDKCSHYVAARRRHRVLYMFSSMSSSNDFLWYFDDLFWVIFSAVRRKLLLR